MKNIYLFAAFTFFIALSLPAADSWSGPAFSSDPQALLKDASAITPAAGVNVLVLLEETHFSYNAAGRETYTRRQVARIVTKDGAEAWAKTSTHWKPWLQEKPQIRARVVTADGQVHLLDPQTIAEAPGQNHDSDVYSDSRDLEAPLPAIAAGAVVEEVTVIHDRVPEFEAGSISSIWFGHSKAYPVNKTVLVIEAPSSLPLHHLLKNIEDQKLQREEKDGVVRLTLTLGPLGEIADREYFLPYNEFAGPGILFSTGKSWSDVANSYSSIVDKQISGANLKRLLPDGPVKGTPRQVAATLLARVQKEVRYTGVEFGDAAYVPRSPAEVLQRRYGDCKDQSALLVALLRASGVPAHVALTNAANSIDPPSELPGFGYFDHAIVYVESSEPFWIDPTDSHSGAAEIPIAEQGRMALIASSKTTDLTRIPESTAADNRQVEMREVILAEDGYAHVTESTQAWGARAHGYREFEGTEAAKLKEQLSDYVKNVYLSSDLARAEVSHKGLDLPAGLVLDINQSKRGSTSLSDAVVYVRLESVASVLPKFFRTEPAEDKKDLRKGDLLLPEPHIYEIRYHVVPPAGYILQKLPANESRDLGKAKFTQEYQSRPDGSVDAVVRFDTGPRLMTANDAEAMRNGVVSLYNSEAVPIRFEQKGIALVEAGNVLQGVKELRAMLARNPKGALSHLQLALGYQAAGLGDAARAEARKAVELDPKSVTAQRQLGWILEHDLLGRSLKKGFDYAGAEAAFRAALKIDPDNLDVRLLLAGLLEHNTAGVWYGAGSRLDEALGEYAKLGKKLETTDFVVNPTFDLIWSRKFKEAEEAARKLPAGPKKNFLLMTAIAAKDGPDAAIQEGNRMFKDAAERVSAYSTAGDTLMKLRLYSQASRLLEASAQGAQNAAAVLNRANLIKQMKRHEENALPDTDPKSVSPRYLAVFFASDMDKLETDLKPVLAKRVLELSFRTEDNLRQLKSTAKLARASLTNLGLPADVATDLILSIPKVTAEGDPSFGYRLRVVGIDPSGKAQTMYVKQENGRYVMLDEASNPNAIGAEILALAEAGDLASARKWLDWLHEDMERGGGDDPLSGHLYPRFWTRGQEGDLKAIQAAAAALLCDLKSDTRAVPILMVRLAESNTDEERGLALWGLATAFNKHQQFQEAQASAERLLKIYPDSDAAFALLTEAFNSQLRWSASIEAAEARLKRRPNDKVAIRVLSRAAEGQGNYAEAEKQIRRLMAAGKAVPSDWNQLGWQALYHPPFGEQLISEVLQGAGSNPGFGVLHTIAMMYAEMDHPSQARDVLLQAMTAAGMDEPEDNVWLVVGRLAEAFDARDAAIAAYRKLEKPKFAYMVPNSSYELAQRRLAALKN